MQLIAGCRYNAGTRTVPQPGYRWNDRNADWHYDEKVDVQEARIRFGGRVVDRQKPRAACTCGLPGTQIGR